MTVKEYLYKCGISPDLAGYYYLKDMIEERIESLKNKQLKYEITKHYDRLAKKYNSGAQKIERCVRHAIESTAAGGIKKNHFLNKVFGNFAEECEGITNKLFVCVSAEYVFDSKMEIESNIDGEDL